VTNKSTVQFGELTLREERLNRRATGYWILDIPQHFDGNSKRKRQRFPSKTAGKNHARQLIKRLRLIEHNTAKGVTGFTLNDVFPLWKDDELQKIVSGVSLPKVPRQ
jgi:hypothetical protein